MQIKLTSVFVDDQDKALKFYTEVLGFAKKMEFTAGEIQMAHSSFGRRTGRRATGSRAQRQPGCADVSTRDLSARDTRG